MTAKEELDMWRSLLAHPGWHELERIADEQRAVRLATIINGVTDLREEDKQRGEYLGIGLLTSVPQAQIDALSVELDNMKQENEDER